MKEKIILLLENSIKELGIADDNIVLEIPKNKDNGDYSTNIALKNCKKINLNPMDLAQKIIDNINDEDIQDIKIAPPGFINFFLEDEFFSEVLREIKRFGTDYGTLDYGRGKKVMVEFVSANPTGPMHIGNARGGALGDCLASVLEKAGYDVRREFYVNDAGNQIEKFALSLDVRYQQICNGEDYISMPENGYQGQDIKDLASEF